MKTSIRKEQGGVPTGGSTSDVLQKASGSNYDTAWGPGGGGGGGTGGSALGQWSTPISAGTPWQATSDGFVVVQQNCSGGGVTASIEIYTDSNPTPTTLRTRANTFLNGGASFVNNINAVSPVKAGDYVLVSVTNTGGSGSIYWIPLVGGSSTLQGTASMTIDGSVIPKPIVFGDGSTSTSFFGFGNTGLPTFQNNIGQNATNEKYCYMFQIKDGNSVLVDQLSCWNQIVGTPGDSLRFSIQTASAGVPTGTILASGTTVGSAGGGRSTVTFSSPLELSAPAGGGDVEFAMVVDRTGALDGSNYWIMGSENLGGTNQGPFKYDTGAWTNDNDQPSIAMNITFLEDNFYLSAQATGNRMESTLISSSSGNPATDTIPALLQTTYGWINANLSIGDTGLAAVSGTMTGFSSIPLDPNQKYICDRSDGHITPGSSGNIVGRALTTDGMLILPQ